MDGAGFDAREFFYKRDYTFRIQLCVRIQRDLQRRAQRTIGRRLFCNRWLFGDTVLAFSRRFSLRWLSVRFWRYWLGYRSRWDVETLRVFLRFRGERRCKILSGVLFLLVVPHAERSCGQILQHLL